MRDEDDPDPEGSDETPDQESPGDLGSDALRNFFQNLSDRISMSEIEVSSREEKDEAMKELAAEMGLEEEYLRGDEEEQFFAVCRVRERYEELLQEGKIQESPEVAKETEAWREWHRGLNAYLRGDEDTVYSGVDNIV